MPFSMFVALVFACLLITWSVCKSESTYTYYVRPLNVPSTNCPSEPCHDLDYYAEYASSLLSRKNTSVALLFLGGTHYLNKALEIYDSDSVQMSGILDGSPSVVNISVEIGMKFFHLTDLHMSNLTFVNSQHESRVSFNATLIERFSHHHVVAASCSLQLSLVSKVVLYHSQYPDNSLINITNTYAETIPYVKHTELNFPISLEISHCVFLNGSDFLVVIDSQIKTQFLNGSISDTSGFSINFAALPEEYRVDLVIQDCLSGGGVSVDGNLISTIDSHFEIIIKNCSISRVHTVISTPIQAYINRSLLIINSTFYNGSQLTSQNFFTDVVLRKCSLQNTAVFLTNVKLCNFMNVTFANSLFYLRGPSKMTLKDSSFLSGNSSLIHNIMLMQSPFIVSDVDLTFLGEVIFKNNTGYQGGALYMFNSNAYLSNGSKLAFVNNEAFDKGGAIYVDNPKDDRFSAPNDLPLPIKCTFSLNYNIETISNVNSSVVFSNNSAFNGGNHLYGVSLKSVCHISPDNSTSSAAVQSKIISFTSESLSRVSSEPKRVCLCEDNTPRCANYSYIFRQRQYVPGEKLSVRLSLVGYDFGTTIGTLYLQSLPSQDYSVNDEHLTNVTSLLSPGCSNVEYTVHSKSETGSVLYFLTAKVMNMLEIKNHQLPDINSSIEIYKSSGEISHSLGTIPVIFNISISKCPLGFTFNHTSKVCQCTVRKESISTEIKCAIVNGEGAVYRSGTTWVSATIWPLVSDPGKNRSVEVFVYDYCPNGYCKMCGTKVNLQKPDSQCALNHSGILCGGCATDMSLALGSHRCLPCSGEEHIAIIIAFVFAGFFLVFFIKLLNFTITTGTINGLVLYANVLWTSQSVFFPYTLQQSSIPLHFFATFIAWVNLDLGIQTCFIPGLDMYWKTWLQFLFPLYIWSLAGLIILACHFSTKLTELFGKNSVHVLATMFLLSYSKMLRAIITSLGFALLYYQNETRIVWLADGNIHYFGLRHSFLFVAALIFLIAFWIPYTTTILLVPFLRKYFNFSWVNRLKPFYDAHFGPLKDKHQYWIGLTLLVRVILALSDIALQAVDPTLNIYMIVIISSLLIFTSNSVFKQWYLSLLEASFIVNLTILSCGFLYTNDEYQRLILASVSVGVAFLTFVVILISRCYARIKLLCCKTNAASSQIPHEGYEDLERVNESESKARTHPTQTVVSTDSIQSPDHLSFREPLLDNSNT